MSARAGFTLLELLVVMTLLGLIGVVAAGGLRFGLAAWERGGSTGMAATEANQALKAVRRLIDGARPIPLRAHGDQESAILFTGSPDRLIFAAPLPAAVAPPGDFLVELRLTGDRLMLRATPLGHEIPTLGPEPLSAVLVEGLSGAHFRYFGPMLEEGDQDATASMDWQPVWARRAALPMLVALDLDWAEDMPLAQNPGRQPGFVARLGAAPLVRR